MASNDSESTAYSANQSGSLKHSLNNGDGRGPAKRSRKAINCEPCRASKLKCDRARPCSSCVLRGTVASCYQDGREDGRSEDAMSSRSDPHQEIARMRQALATLEAHLLRGGLAVLSPVPAPALVPATTPILLEPSLTASVPVTKLEPIDNDDIPDLGSNPGLLAREGPGSLYTGATCLTADLVRVQPANDAKDSDNGTSNSDSQDGSGNGNINNNNNNIFNHHHNAGPKYHVEELDKDLRDNLPSESSCLAVVYFYFDNCNWIYRHVNEKAFHAAWTKSRESHTYDRLTFTTLCFVMALATRYLPNPHPALSMDMSREQAGQLFYETGIEALNRYKAENNIPSVELVEILLIRSHYLTLSKTQSEEIWNVCVEVTGIGTAMGLHRDPDRWNLPDDVVERRRWAWWHIILLQYWQCFLFGRPLIIALHHFDTLLPFESSDRDKKDPSGERMYTPNIYLFKLAAILGGIVDDAVSVRQVPYQRVQDHDNELQRWLDELPKELDMDEYKLTRRLQGQSLDDLKLGVQSVIIRNSYYHIRLALHRPYAAAAHGPPGARTPSGTSGINPHMDARLSRSLDVAVSCADKLVQLVSQAGPELLDNSTTAVPGHVHWGPFHSFTAALFFSFQLVANPEQPGANIFRANINKTINILSNKHYIESSVAKKGIEVLRAMAPLYDKGTGDESPFHLEIRERKKKDVLSVVYTKGLPYFEKVANRPNVPVPTAAATVETNIYQHTRMIMPTNPAYGMAPHGMQSGVDIYTSIHSSNIPQQMAAPPIYTSHPQILTAPPPPPPHMRHDQGYSNMPSLAPISQSLVPVSAARTRMPPPPPPPPPVSVTPAPQMQQNMQTMSRHQPYTSSSSQHHMASSASVSMPPGAQSQAMGNNNNNNSYMAQSHTSYSQHHAQAYAASQVQQYSNGGPYGQYGMTPGECYEDAVLSNAMGFNQGGYSRLMDVMGGDL